ncbi:DNA repair protein RecO [Candidatus Parcubacteria bacterium]|nr:DNA repair protein RecO [Candidatus Parcubacteria bacterium]
MAHHVYNTEGFIVESAPRGEANKMYLIFTEELGMVRATAQGVRFLKSKLRFALQDMSYARVSLVRGKDMWRVTNARAEWNVYKQYKDNKDVLFALAQIFALLRRLIPGEEKNEALFRYLYDACMFLESKELLPEEVKSYERIVVLNILHYLGYGVSTQELAVFIDVPLSTELLEKMIKEKTKALQEINRSLKETQL